MKFQSKAEHYTYSTLQSYCILLSLYTFIGCSFVIIWQVQALEHSLVKQTRPHTVVARLGSAPLLSRMSTTLVYPSILAT